MYSNAKILKNFKNYSNRDALINIKTSEKPEEYIAGIICKCLFPNTNHVTEDIEDFYNSDLSIRFREGVINREEFYISHPDLTELNLHFREGINSIDSLIKLLIQEDFLEIDNIVTISFLNHHKEFFNMIDRMIILNQDTNDFFKNLPEDKDEVTKMVVDILSN